MKASLRAVVGAIVCLLLLGTAARAQRADLKVRGQYKHVHGVNVGWFFGRYSTDLGLNPLHPDWGNGYSQSQADAWLADMKRMRINVVRVWLHEGLEGLTFDSNGYVSGVQPGFLTNLDHLVGRANYHGLALYLTFLNHDLVDQFGQRLPNGATVKNFVTDATARQRLLDNALGAIASRYRNNLGVFGYDLINEANIGADNGSYNWSQMRTFASQAAAKIHNVAPGSQVTMSTQWYAFGDQANHPYWFGGLGLDFYDYHEYNNAPNLPSRASWLDKPLLLGEHGPTTWDEASQRNASDKFIEQAAYRNWAGNLSWMYWHSPGSGESIVRTPGGNQDWENLAWSIQWWGINRFGL
jgi:endo-1,4-beta-mannosidase